MVFEDSPDIKQAIRRVHIVVRSVNCNSSNCIYPSHQSDAVLQAFIIVYGSDAVSWNLMNPKGSNANSPEHDRICHEVLVIWQMSEEWSAVSIQISCADLEFSMQFLFPRKHRTATP